MPNSIITHKGKKILYSDYRDLTNQADLINVLKEAVEITKSSAGMILRLDDFRGTGVGQEYMASAKVYGKEVLTAKTTKVAVLGITGLKRILMKAYVTFSGEKLAPFNTEEEAKDYLVS